MRQRYAIAGVLVLIGSVIWILIASFPREPTYRGKSLRYWVKGYRAGNYQWNASFKERADTAVRRIGSNAVPTLLRMIVAEDSDFDKSLVRWSCTWRGWAQRQHFVRVAPIPHLHSYEAIEAFHAFRALGPGASCAVPDLIRLLDENLPSWNHESIVLILGDIGPPAKQAVPVLLRELKASDPAWRANALYALGGIHADSKLVLPEITKNLQDSDPNVRRWAAGALKTYGTQASSAVPALLEAVQKWDVQPSPRTGLAPDPDDPALAAREALKAIDPAAAARVGIK